MARRDAGSWRAALAGPAFSALLIGISITMAATGRVTVLDAAVVVASWSFAPAIQLLAGALMIATAPARTVSMARALELLFAGHVPWSLWILAATAWVVLTPPPFWGLGWLALSAVLAAIWSGRILSAFCRTVLGDQVRRARLRVTGHQTLVWSIALAYGMWAGGIWPRILGMIVALLDGVEAAHPGLHVDAQFKSELEAFHARARALNPDIAPIGSSDFHGMPSPGLCRTYVLATEPTEAGVIDAVRSGRTVAADRDGNLTGDPAHVHAVQARRITVAPPAGVDLARRVSLACTWVGLLALVLFGSTRRE